MRGKMCFDTKSFLNISLLSGVSELHTHKLDRIKVFDIYISSADPKNLEVFSGSISGKQLSADNPIT